MITTSTSASPTISAWLVVVAPGGFGDGVLCAGEQALAAARKRLAALPQQERSLERLTALPGAGDHLARHFAEVPVVLVFCHDPRMLAQGGEDDPQPKFLFGGSLYPAIQNLLLACRAEGLGGVLTTMSWRREAEILRALEIPDPWRLHAVVPIGYPEAGGHGPLARKPVSTMAYRDRWRTAYRGPFDD